MEPFISLTPRYGIRRHFSMFKHICFFFRRVFITTNEFNDLLEKSNALRDVEKCFDFKVDTKTSEAKNKSGAVLFQFPTSREVTVNADINGVLKALGYRLSKSVNWNITKE